MWKTIIPLLVGAAIWVTPHTAAIKPDAWQLLAIFTATIIAFITRPLPIGAVAVAGIIIAVLTKSMNMADALSGYANASVWLIVAAVFFSRGIIESGLGRRIAYHLIRRFGSSSLSLAYAITMTDLVLSPATVSNTARGGGIVYPIVQNLCYVFDSRPGDTARRIGAFLITIAHVANTTTVTVFLTACSGNLLITSLGKELLGYDVTWWQWFVAGSVPGAACLIFLPWLIYKVYPPELKETPEAPILAAKELEAMGPITKYEKQMAFVFLLCILLWSTTEWTGINPTIIAFIGVFCALVFKTVTWDQILQEKMGWDILIWMGTIVGMAGVIAKKGVVKVFATYMGTLLGDLDWLTASFFISFIFVYSQYFFASGTARITALFTGLASIMVGLGAPPFYTIMMFGLMNSPGCTLTHYSSGVTPIFFGAGYVPQTTWWRVGLIVSIASYILHYGLGTLWMISINML